MVVDFKERLSDGGLYSMARTLFDRAVGIDAVPADDLNHLVHVESSALCDVLWALEPTEPRLEQ